MRPTPSSLRADRAGRDQRHQGIARPGIARRRSVSAGARPTGAQGAGRQRDQARVGRAQHPQQSGRSMLDAVCHGTTDPEVLTDVGQRKLLKKIDPCAQAGAGGRFDPLHACRPQRSSRAWNFLDQTDRAALGRDRGAAALSPRGLSCCAVLAGSRPEPRRTSSQSFGGDYLRKRDPERQTKRLIVQPERRGHKVALRDRRSRGRLHLTADSTPAAHPERLP